MTFMARSGQGLVGSGPFFLALAAPSRESCRRPAISSALPSLFQRLPAPCQSARSSSPAPVSTQYVRGWKNISKQKQSLHECSLDLPAGVKRHLLSAQTVPWTNMKRLHHIPHIIGELRIPLIFLKPSLRSEAQWLCEMLWREIGHALGYPNNSLKLVSTIQSLLCDLEHLLHLGPSTRPP